MCGILGCSWEDRDFIQSGLKQIKHRGPDGFGIYFDKGVSLGHRRLAIVDLSKRGKQPMHNEDESVWVVFNGEIYNFRALREELKGHEFTSDTDTEVLVHGYEEWGLEGLLERLQGAFAFCLYDKEKDRMFLVRDRLGIKPLYYFVDRGRIAFCSEMKALIGLVKKKRVNLDALASYLTFRAATTEEAMLDGVKKVMPGSYVVWDLKGNKLQKRGYWGLPQKTEKRGTGAWTAELRALLDDSVRARLMADVPYGAFLSGGVDSGSVVALMQQHAERTVKTFSVGFQEEEHSEAEAAQFLSQEMGTQHHELLVGRDSVRHLPAVVAHADEPFADPTAIPTYLLSGFTKKKGVTVVLTGEGADEVFAGYPQYRFLKGHQLIAGRMPKSLRSGFPALIRWAPGWLLDKGFGYASALGEKGVERFGKFLVSDDPEEQWLEQVSIFDDSEREDVIGKQPGRGSLGFEKFTSSSKDVVREAQRAELKGSMVDDLLMKVDKQTMAFGVEGRVPFLDHRIVELGWKMPTALKLRGLTGKWILRQAMKGVVPAATLTRKKKHFFVPIDSWLGDELTGLREKLLGEKYLKRQGLFDERYVDKMFSDWSGSRLFYSRQAWSLICFQLWYEQVILGEKVRRL
ncbi:asparagine synthase (glutamine-hydrolyzing) [Candidatus Pacearchaeota archaeon]|nr:asparagine synthase (glutamine-hydrolyzing) [Candidatus Pacearchaeota archaeon]